MRHHHRTRAVGRSLVSITGVVLATLLGARSARAEASEAAGAQADAPARATVVAGHYPASGFKRSMLGAGYRELWAKPISVEVLNLQKEAGGLTVFRRVGGQQTHGLALTGADGRSYTFRGLDKDASHLLDTIDPELADSIVAKVLNDLMSAQHPASELIARGILDATGVPCPAWRLVTLPDDPALGKFQKDFAGAIGVFAEYPQPAKGAVPGFLGATEIIDHLELYKRLEAGAATADSRALLKARLVDIFMGDWDRHRLQWRWAMLPGKTSFTPIPEDRDQAFSRYEGFVLARARATDPRFQNFGPKYPDIKGLTSNGSEQDRLLLVGFSREDFVETANALKAQLTDEAIEKAARMMPPEWYAIDGPRLVTALRARRNALPQIAGRYYENLAHRVDVYLTARNEHVEAKRLGHGDMDLTVSVVGQDGQPGAPTYHRLFHDKETEEVRVYAQAGNDTMKVTGGGKGPHVRMIGGKGDDTLDATGAGNAKLSDSDGNNKAVDAQFDDHPYTKPPPPANASWIPPRDFGSQGIRFPIVAYNADIGVYLGYSFQKQWYDFRKSPYGSSHQITGGWSFAEMGGRLAYNGEFHRENRSSYFSLYAYGSSIDVLRYYGLGNETTATGDSNFYKASSNQYVAYPAFRVPFAKRGLFTIGPVMKHTSNDPGKDQFINTEPQPYGAGGFGALAVHGILSWDGRDNLVFPRHGVLAVLRSSYFPEAWDVVSAFGQINGNVGIYLPVGKALTIATRVGGKHTWGNYPYMEGAALGQGGLGLGVLAEPDNTLRGYRSRRYLGDSSVFSNTDLRLRISHMNIILPGAWGITLFGDVGRVWLEGETSDTWHTGVGGGLWFSYLANKMVFSVGLAHGKEDDLIYFKGGFGF